MITREKIAIYEKYEGDSDGWSRVGTDREKSVMGDQDWHDIENLIQRLSIVSRGLASSEYIKETEELLTTKTADDDETRNMLRKLAK